MTQLLLPNPELVAHIPNVEYRPNRTVFLSNPLIQKQAEDILEARVGIEPTHKGFADLSLTTWVPRLNIGLIVLALSEL
jgi:hypothetical protein